MKRGTLITAPVSMVAGLLALVAVSPLAPGHGELSFHHNPHLQLAGAWAFLLLALFGAKAQDWKMQLTLVSVHCCELCALKQKPGVLLEKTNKQTKSQLQTVLITASGPQAYNALVHRERYTQGSRQNRCVSSQEALALRARQKPTGRSVSFRVRPFFSSCFGASVTLARWWRPLRRLWRLPSRGVHTSCVRVSLLHGCRMCVPHSFSSLFFFFVLSSFTFLRELKETQQKKKREVRGEGGTGFHKLPTQNCLRRGIQLYN